MADAVLRGGSEARAAVAGWLATLAARNDGRDFSCTPARRRRRAPKQATTDDGGEGAPPKQAVDPSSAPAGAKGAPPPRGSIKTTTSSSSTATSTKRPHATSIKTNTSSSSMSSLRSLTSSFSATAESPHEVSFKKRRKTGSATRVAHKAGSNKSEDEGSSTLGSFSSSSYPAPSSSPAADTLPHSSFPPLPSPFPVDQLPHYSPATSSGYHHHPPHLHSHAQPPAAYGDASGWGGRHPPYGRSGSWSGGHQHYQHHQQQHQLASSTGYGGATYPAPPSTAAQWDNHQRGLRAGGGGHVGQWNAQHHHHQQQAGLGSHHNDERKWSMPAVLEAATPYYGGDGGSGGTEEDDWDAFIRVLRTKTVQQEGITSSGPPMAALRPYHLEGGPHSSTLDEHLLQRLSAGGMAQPSYAADGGGSCALDEEVEALLRSVLPS